MPDLAFLPLRPEYVRSVELQPSQQRPLGLEHEPSEDEIARMCAGPVAWAAVQADRVLACYGVVEQFGGMHGTGWAMLSTALGAAHLAITRQFRRELDRCALPRMEMLARCHDVEGLLSRRPWLDPGQVVAIAMTQPTPEIRWGLMMGFAPAHVLRCYGANGESVMLMERIAPALRAGALGEAA